ncbi:hypothetical protein E4O03_02960 [Treponema sp. OMZ 792]|uniref:alpha-2-macroglobulin family protein n=1 Tax=unclassified Treponema TaxID=2638727 RepID=UPI0020A5C3CE|nr:MULTISPECIES: alpha-2-macroglobulin family protein [unclassified Treponema]UTC75699.1 hypothetical protein E4O03_02960 [Treponema sp. OMZ 792]UTC79698.1 hypothetical protein E4O07_02970 [Treponema sp. OMZ 798]
MKSLTPSLKQLLKALIFVLSVSVFVAGCKKSEQTLQNAMDDIESVSYGALKRLEPINVIFKEEIKYPENLEKACVFNPKPSGEWKIIGKNQISFIPSSAYNFKTDLNLDLDVSLLLENTEKKKTVSLTFSIARPEFILLSGELIPDEKRENIFRFEGIGETDIPESITSIEKMLTAELKLGNTKSNPAVKVSQGPNSNQYKIIIKEISRKKEVQHLNISWDLAALGGAGGDSRGFTVAAQSVFQVTSFYQETGSEISVNFSDALDPSQDLRGFIRIASSPEIPFRYSIDGYKLKIFSQSGIFPDDTKISILPGIKNSRGKKLESEADFAITVAWEKPIIRFTKAGNITPAKEMSVLVSTKNISGLMLEAFQIYDKNMAQFFQINSIDGSDELNRVGEPVWRQSFDFEWTSSMKNKTVQHSLDISKLVKQFPGGMFELRASFTKKHSMYQSPSKNNEFAHLPFPKDISELENFKNIETDYWNTSEIEDEDRYNFWQQRENPNHPAFYLPSYSKYCMAIKKVLVSNIGLSAKKDRDGKLYISAADLLTAEPMSGVKISLFNFAQKELESGKTDSDGLLMLKNENQAFLIKAEKNGDVNWLPLNSDILSTSHFQVEGESSKKGVKGYIYGERGVWRPGDDIHLVFILQDLEKNLPKDYPVKFYLEDPLGKKTESKVFTSSVDGFYRIDTKTNPQDKTGTWYARVTAGGKTWSKSIKVEAIVPNRLFVNLNPKAKYFSEGYNPAVIGGEWLHGAKASGLKAEISARYVLNRNPFENYKNYNFINPELRVQQDLNKIWEGNLDDSGKADINLYLSSEAKSPGKLKAVFETRIYEPSGAFSMENKVFDYSPYSRYVGMQIPKSDDEYREMLYTGKDQSLNFVVLDPEGNPVKEGAALKVSLYKLEWYWWWEKDEEAANYTNSRHTRHVRDWSISAKDGKAKLNIKVDNGSWGRYLIMVSDPNGGHSSAQVVYFDWEGWASRRTTDESSDSIIMLTTDKAKYYADETAEITFPGYEGAKALITVEKNGKVLKQEWVKSKGKIFSYKIKLDPSMAPNIYAHVSLIQEHSQTKNSLPIRMYGITPVMIENKLSRLSPVINTEQSFEPNSKVSFTVSEEKGRPMTFTVAVVDEGLLGLTAFYTGNPWDSFYKKESSQIASWDIYKYVIGAYSGKIESILSVGGGGFIDNKTSKNAERFKPIVYFFGPFEIKAKEKKTIEFDLPQYIGALRIMAVAGKDGAYGIKEETVKVKSDLIVMPTLPRTMGIGETIEVPVTVFNGTSSEKKARVVLKSEGAVNSNETKEVSIPANSDSSVFFTVKTDKGGIAKFTAEASASGISKMAKAVTEIDVLSRGTPYSTVELINIEAGKTFAKTLPLKGENGTKSLNIEVSQMPALGLENRLAYLLGYPYGCIEQITSKAFPQLYLNTITALDQTEIDRAKSNVNSVLDRYINYQLRSGGFSYWPDGGYESAWATNYAGHFMVEAKKAGYEVNDSIYQSWLSHQTETAKNWAGTFADSMEAQAYRLYTLALAGKAEIGAMNRLKNMEQSLNSVSRAFLANAYSLAGHNSTAKTMLEKLYEPTSVYRSTGGNFSSNIRDLALILNAYTMAGENAKTTNLISKLAKISSSNEWLSTQETAWILLALAPHYAFDKNKSVSYEIVTEANVIKDKLNNASKLHKIPVNTEAEKKIEIKNTGNTPIFAAINTAGKLNPGTETRIEENLRLNLVYRNEDGQEVSPEALKKGQRFKMSVRVHNKTQGALENLTLSIPIPTGWEITNTRLGGDDDTDSEDKRNARQLYDFQDLKDTHIYTHFALEGYGTKDFEFTGTVTYGGEYYIPAIFVEAMYDYAYRAILPGTRIKAFE